MIELLPVLAEPELPALVNAEQHALLSVQLSQHVQLMVQQFVMTYKHLTWNNLSRICKNIFLDNLSQDYIKKTIDDLVKDHTVIIVAHRLSTIVDADVINIIDKGKLESFGTHEELLTKSKVYQTLYSNENSPTI